MLGGKSTGTMYEGGQSLLYRGIGTVTKCTRCKVSSRKMRTERLSQEGILGERMRLEKGNPRRSAIIGNYEVDEQGR